MAPPGQDGLIEMDEGRGGRSQLFQVRTEERDDVSCQRIHLRAVRPRQFRREHPPRQEVRSGQRDLERKAVWQRAKTTSSAVTGSQRSIRGVKIGLLIE